MSWRLTTRTDPRSGRPGAIWWMSAGALTAIAVLAAYYLDPQSGRARRHRVVERTRSLVPHELRPASAPDAVASGGWPEEPPPDVDSD